MKHHLKSPVTVIIGGQYGSEGKGAVVAYLTDPIRCHEPLLVIRTGGPNAGHSLRYKDETYKMRHIACAWPNPKAILALGPGSLVDPEWLLNEEIPMLEKIGIDVRGRLFIDPSAAVILDEHKEAEATLRTSIGSTGKGIGAATAARVMRTGVLARDFKPLQRWLYPVDELVEDAMEKRNIIIESTQGWALSLTRSRFYPYATSRDITPAQVLNDAGVPSQFPHDVIMVMRTYPIRVAGNSGPIHGETDWETLAAKTVGYVQEERTTVTNLVRRVGEWDPKLARQAANALRPHSVALTFFDYVRPDLAVNGAGLDSHAMDRIRKYEADMEADIRWVSMGFQKLIDLGSTKN